MTLRQELATVSQVKTPADMQQLAVRIETLPVVNVDANLVEFALELSSLMRESAEIARRLNDPSTFVALMIRGASGDVFGPANEHFREQNALTQKWNAMQAWATRIRAVLSQRYGAEFPPI